MNKKLALLLSVTVILGFSTNAMASDGTTPIVNLNSLNLSQTPVDTSVSSMENLPALNADVTATETDTNTELSTETNETTAEETATEQEIIIKQETIPTMEKPEPPVNVSAIEYEPDLYKKPNFEHAKDSYTKGNFTGAAQELFAYLKQNPKDPQAFYYLAMTLAGLGDTDAAVQSYEKAASLTEDELFKEIALKGRDCLIGGPLCAVAEVVETHVEPTPEEAFIIGPYGDGLHPDIKERMKYEKLQDIQDTINRKQELDVDEVQEIKDFDEKYSGFKTKDEEGEEETEGNMTGFAANMYGEDLSKSEVSNEDIVSAINTLRKAGMVVTIQPSTQPMGYQNSQMAEMSMLLGGNQNNYNDPMNQMVPYMMQASTPQGAQNINPQMVQAMMMNSMMSNFDFNTSDKD